MKYKISLILLFVVSSIFAQTDRQLAADYYDEVYQYVKSDYGNSSTYAEFKIFSDAYLCTKVKNNLISFTYVIKFDEYQNRKLFNGKIILFDYNSSSTIYDYFKINLNKEVNDVRGNNFKFNKVMAKLNWNYEKNAFDSLDAIYLINTNSKEYIFTTYSTNISNSHNEPINYNNKDDEYSLLLQKLTYIAFN